MRKVAHQVYVCFEVFLTTDIFNYSLRNTYMKEKIIHREIRAVEIMKNKENK